MLSRSFLPSLIGSALLVGLASCTGTPKQDNISPAIPDDRPLVVATTSVLCDLTRQIAGESINLKCLVDAGVDPHVYQAKPEDRQAIDAARLILYGGYNFDESLIKLVKASSNSAPKVAVHEQAVTKPLMGGSHAHDHDEHDHDHPQQAEGNTPDPHVWHNPRHGMAMVNIIAQELEKLHPEQAQEYQKNAKAMDAEITRIDNWISAQIATIPPQKRKLVTTHDALGYYVDAYQLEFEGAIAGLSTEESPTAARVSELVKDIKKTNVPTIFAESSVNPKLIETVAREAQVKVSERKLYADGLGEKGTDGETYQKMLVANTQTIVEGLGGKYTPFPF